jgi:predicted acylesterase/phospholipase RssA
MNNLVFQGGGMHGYAHIGGIKSLQKHGKYKASKFAGASVGALVAFALACHIDVDEIYRRVEMIDEDLLTGGRGFCYACYCLLKRGGLYSTKTFRKWIEKTNKVWIGSESITFDELHARFGTELYVVVTSLGHSGSLVLCRQNYPTLNIVDALEMTIAIPFIYEPIRFQNDLIVDGGLINNMPLHIFDTKENDYFSKDTLAFSVVTKEEMRVEMSQFQTPPRQIRGFWSITQRIVSMVLDYASRYQDDPRDTDRMIPICVGSVDSFDFTISNATKQHLLQAGENYVDKWLRENSQTDFIVEE